MYLQQFVRAGQAGANVLVEIPGCERPDEDVIAGGHYDHLDSRSDAAGACSARGTPGGAICPGATDNAAGAVVVGIGKALVEGCQPSSGCRRQELAADEPEGVLCSADNLEAVLVAPFCVKGCARRLPPSLRQLRRLVERAAQSESRRRCERATGRAVKVARTLERLTNRLAGRGLLPPGDPGARFRDATSALHERVRVLAAGTWCAAR